MGNYLARIIFVALGSLFFVWSVVRAQNSPTPDGIDLREIDPDTAWRLFSKGISPEEALENVKIEGDEYLAKVALGMVSVMA